MTVQNMEISLNVSVGSGPGKNTETDDDSILNLMRSQKTGTQKINVTNSSKIKHDSNKKINTAKKRVKQKLLGTIVAQKLKETNKVNQNQASVVHSKLKSNVKSKDTDNKTLKQKAVKSVKKNEEGTETNKSLSAEGSEVSNDPVISFTKVTKENFGKTLLARKRKSPDKSSNKTLASIFSKQKEPEKDVSLLSSFGKADSVEEVPPKKNFKFDEPKTVSFTNHSKKEKQKHAEKPTRKSNISVENEKGTQVLHKSSGKISSLFGHNPEIPHIGQRLVKPINEPVFAATNFTDLNIHPFMISNLEQNMQITKMTIVQQKAIPQILSGKDVLIRSQTGSGKTLAYALPIVEFLHRIRPKLNRNSGLKALVVVPTRELALQTYECFLKLVKSFTWVVPGYLAGGEKRKAEKARLRKGCNILISTPGRLLDHVQRTAALKLTDIKYFVLDEADRMFDLGYEKDISSIVSALKVSIPNENTEYDAMKIFQRNVKKVFTDDDVEQMASNPDTKTEAHNDVSIESDKNTESESEDVNNEEKQVYHSSSDNDSDAGEPYIKSIKTDKKKVCSGTVSKKKSSDLKNSTIKDEHNTIVENQTGRQTILLSATLTQSVEKLAGLAMNHPVFVDAATENLKVSGGVVADLNEDLIVPQSMVQSYIVTPPKLRMVTLSAYIAGKCQSHGQHKILVFMATQDMVDYHTEILSSVLTKPVDEDDDDSDPLVDVEFFKLHGNMTQKERTDVFKTFRQANSGVLLCTDVAARGLDLPKVDCVVQYTGPTSARDYVHRIGRTARAGSSGSATIFLIPSEIDFVRMLESRRIRIKQENMDDVLDKLMSPLSKHSSTQGAAIALQNEFENMVLEDPKLRDKAYRAYTSWIRFYSGYPRDMREIFNRKNVHLGHFAKSFALRQTPQRIGGIEKKLREKEVSKPQHNNRLHKPTTEKPDGEPAKKQQHQRQGDERKPGLLKRVRMLNTSEYDSGLEPVKKPKKS
nr:PREDICTED: probable ATP-dependent RNA helicase CG8611 [Megachile rotundata]